jgi:uncharacterized phiE125 gp8 family phage protein
MQWTQTHPGSAILTLQNVLDHLRMTNTQGQDNYLTSLITVATAYAENAMGCSLITRTVTATFFANEHLWLPRGPVQAITSVAINQTPAAQGVDPSAFQLEKYGTQSVLRLNNGHRMPYAAPATLTVVYQAGYGDSPSDVPADIIQAIQCMIGLMFENRETAQDRTVTPVPFLEAFFKARAIDVGVG